MNESSAEICFVDLSATTCGPWNSFIELAEVLRGRGVRIRAVLQDGWPADAARARLGDDAVSSTHIRRHGIKRDLHVASLIRRRMRSSRLIVHANTVSDARPASMAVYATGTPLVVHLRNSALSRGECLLLRIASQRRWGPVRFVAVSNAARQLAERCGQDVIEVINNPVVAPVTRGAGPMSRPVRVGVVVNGRPTKGFDHLVEIAGESRGRAVAFHVVGLDEPRGGDSFVAACYRRALELGVTNMLRFGGEIPTLAETYRHLDAMLIVSRRESFGRVAAEAMRAGVPVIVPDIPGLSETVDGERNAWIYRAGDAADAARVLADMAAHPEEAFRRARHARASTERFDPTAVADRMLEFYQTLLPAKISGKGLRRTHNRSFDVASPVDEVTRPT